MTRQDQIIKWLVYALALLPIWILDAFLLGRWPLFGTVPLLLPLAVVAVAVLEGATAGAGFGMGVGLLWALGYADVGGGMVSFMVVAGMLSGVAAQYALTQGFAGCFICSTGTLVVLELLRVARGIFIQLAPLPVLLGVAGKELFLTLLWTPAVYFVFLQAFRKVGLDKLA